MAVITEKGFNLWRKAIVPKLLCRTMDKFDDDQNVERKFLVFAKRHMKIGQWSVVITVITGII